MEIVKYGLVGMVSTITNLILFWILNSVGMHYIASNILSYVLAVCLNFVLSKIIVFKTIKNNNKFMIKQGMRYSFVRIINLLVDCLLFYLCVDVAHFPLYPTRIALTLVGILLTFMVNKKWVFK